MIFSLLFINGCTSTGMGVSNDFKLDDEIGLVFLSVRYNPVPSCDSSFATPPLFVGIRHEDGGALSTQTLNIENFLIETDFENPTGYFYALEQKPGKYFIQHSDMSYKNNGVEKQISYLFEVKPNKAVYIGELNFNREHAGNSNGCNIIRVSIKNEFGRDVKLLKNRVPGIASDKVIQGFAKAIYVEK